MTSSPAAGLLVVPLVTVPVRVWAAEARVSEMMAASKADVASLVKRTPVLDAGNRIEDEVARLDLALSLRHPPCLRAFG